MRPTSAEALLAGSSSRPRKLSNTSMSAENTHSAGQPMTFFLADQAAMQASTLTAHSSSSCGSNFGVRSMEASTPTIESLQNAVKELEKCDSEDEDVGSEAEDLCSRETAAAESDTEQEEDELDTLDGQSTVSMQSYPDYMSPKADFSQPMTPILGPATDGPGTPRSTRGAGEMNAPQFIMPEITMPSRRPFTEKGKRISRLKVMIAGDSGELWSTSLCGDCADVLGRYRENIFNQKYRADL